MDVVIAAVNGGRVHFSLVLLMMAALFIDFDFFLFASSLEPTDEATTPVFVSTASSTSSVEGSDDEIYLYGAPCKLYSDAATYATFIIMVIDVWRR